VVCAVPAPVYQTVNGGIGLEYHLLELPSSAGWTSWLEVGRQESQMVGLAPEMLEYLAHEAEQRGISIQEAYEEEIAAQAELDRITPSNAELLALAERFPPPQAWYDE
jgi:hypothetical protein